MSSFKVNNVCFEPWAEKVRNYWKYLGGGESYVLLGRTNGYVILIPKRHPVTGGKVYGLLFNSPLLLPKSRNLLWHEMGHVRGSKSNCPAKNEFHADKWAIERALEKGFTRVAEEIILRCSAHASDESIDDVYRDAAKMVLLHFMDFAKSIVKKYKV